MYTTISPTSTQPRSAAFLRNLARGEAYQAEAPGLWDVTFQTAVAQAELEAREYPGHFHRVAFHAARQRRPGLHRDHPARADPRRASRWSRTRTTSATSRCSARRCARRCSASRCRCSRTALAEPDKGAGIAMCCTFGDLTDVMWWRELQLPTRSVIGRDGRMLRGDPGVAGRRAGRSGVRRARRQDDVLGPRARSSTRCATAATSTASPTPHPADGQLLREGRQAARDRHQPPVVHPQRRPRRGAARGACSQRGRRARLGARRTCGSATRTGSTASTATG